MVLIADSGSTKTTWVLLDGEKVKNTITTNGLNPYFHNSESVEAVIRADLAPFLVESHVREVHFYGAGCSTDYNNNMIRDAIRVFFRNSKISVYHDILGAARALFGDGKGIACILGTGCNSCYFDGTTTYSPIDSLGYLFGDEGAGSYLGKLFLGAYLKKELPADLRDAFDAHYRFTLEDILNSLYNKPAPNRFLASFSHFISPNREHPFIQQLLHRSFRDFFEAHIRKYDDHASLALGFIGSIAHCYSEILTGVANSEGVTISRILSSPVEGLVEYHSGISS
jgi:N-acetylglucosamine kinase-like BadF-type ATPase